MRTREEPVDADDVPPPSQARADHLKERALSGDMTPPENVDVPMVSGPAGIGPAAVGDTLTCTMGNWNGEPNNYAYQWKSDGETNLATGASYDAAVSDVGHSLTCVVTAFNAQGATSAPPSNAITVEVAAAARAPEPPQHQPRSR